MDLQTGISYKFEISPGQGNTKRDFSERPEDSKVEVVTITTQPRDVVNFYNDGKVIGSVYFTRDPVEVQSLDEMFSETETILKQKLG